MPVSRRQFLTAGLGALAGGVVASCTAVKPAPPQGAPAAAGLWSDPRTWGGAVPPPLAHVVVDRPVLLDGDVSVSSLTITPAGSLSFDAATSRALTSRGNVVVKGELVMRPALPAALHRLVFSGIDERRFVGGGMDPIDSDVGLWVMGDGVLDVAGSPKLAWARAAGTIAAGARVVTLQTDPVGWQVGDEVAITPTALGSWDYSTATITAISDRQVSLSVPTLAHPAVAAGPAGTMTAEVLNLTRNVRIDGTPGGRAHIFIRSSRPQQIRRLATRFLGPRKDGARVLGRWGVHFHHMGDAAQGSVVEGAVARDAGSHCYTAHESHGVTFRDCIAHDVTETPYWWDQWPHRTRDSRYERCVASNVHWGDEKFKTAGFLLGSSDRLCVATGCVAVAVDSAGDGSGFFWDNGGEGIWDLEDSVAHNCEIGMRVWQNGSPLHINNQRRVVCYSNTRVGIKHGAYSNRYLYEDCVVVNNSAPVIDAAVGLAGAPVPVIFRGLYVDANGAPDAIVLPKTTAAAPRNVHDPAVLIDACDLRGYTRAGIRVGDFHDVNGPLHFDVRNCTFSRNAFWLDSDIPVGTEVRVPGVGTLRRIDQPGTLRPEWNARVA